jgi:selenocysteine-specific elongation factor
MLARGWVAFQPFARARNLTEAGRDTLLDGAGAVLAGGFAQRRERREQLHAALTEVLAVHHREHPDQPGLPPERLRAAMPERPPLPLFQALLEAALRRGAVRQHGPWLHLPSHQAVLSPQDERLWEVVRVLIAAQRFSPPRTRDMVGPTGVAEPALRAALHRIARFGRLVEVAHDHFFLRETLAEMVSIAAGLERDGGAVTAAAFRDRLGIGRKVAIQVLEFLDTAGVTRRDGDARRVRPERSALFGPPPE